MLDVLRTLGAALRLDAGLFTELGPATVWTAIGVALLAGASTMLGHVAILMLNRIRGFRLVTSVLLSAISLAVLYASQAALTWAVATAMLRRPLPLLPLILVALVALAPLVFNFITALPHLGLGIGRVLQAWSYLVLWLGVATTFHVGWLGALGFTLAGWFVMQLASRLVRRPVDWAYSRLWTLATGRPVMVTSLDILAGMPIIPVVAEPAERGGGAMITWVLGILVLLLVLFVLLSPLESLRWWADKGEQEVKETFALVPPDPEVSVAPARRYVVYLSGVGTIGGDQVSRREEAWLEALADALPGIHLVADVFPYAVDNRGLLQRTTVWLWSRLDRWRRRSLKVVPLLINLRNIAQVLVSADPRYGPTHNIGLAQEIWRSLQRHGYQPGTGTPVTIIGFSGGAQMALGAGWFLAGLGVPVSMISVGGIFGDDPGLDRLTHLWHLGGSRDPYQHLGTIAFPGRWPTAPLSAWGRARREGRITTRMIGPMRHDGARGYFGRRAFGADGRNHADITRDAVVEILTAVPATH